MTGTRKIMRGAALALLGVFVLTGLARAGEPPGRRVGTVDMQQVYMAYPGMTRFRSAMEEMQGQFMEAQQAEDHEKIMAIQQRAQAMQEELTRDFEADLEKAAGPVSREMNIDMIVGEIIYQGNGTEVVDVSQALITAMAGDDAERD